MLHFSMAVIESLAVIINWDSWRLFPFNPMDFVLLGLQMFCCFGCVLYYFDEKGGWFWCLWMQNSWRDGGLWFSRGYDQQSGGQPQLQFSKPVVFKLILDPQVQITMTECLQVPLLCIFTECQAKIKKKTNTFCNSCSNIIREPGR